MLVVQLLLLVALHQQTYDMRATHYGASYHGQRMACGQLYSTSDPTIAAVSPLRYQQWPCGTQLQVTNQATGVTITVTRQDSCPGCASYGSEMIDLSEAGHALVCGTGTCSVQVQEVK
jgi:rare lipoprotein A (peptidoglycan hydrolase)